MFLSPAPLARQTRPKLSCSPDFNGERYNGCAFLNSCSLYICLAPEQEKILWALTFFKGGRATKWSENVFRQEANTSVFPIQTWGDFEQQFQLHFFPVNAEADAINALEVSQKVTYLFCDELDIVSKELRSRVRQATKDVVKSEV